MTDRCTLYRASELLPAAWTHFSREGPVRIFNPGLLAADDGFLFAYRVVGPDQQRRIGICRLDQRLQVQPGSAVAWSDHVEFRADQELGGPARVWFADPRLYRFGGRTFMYWNSGWHEPHNHQFLQEIDPRTLLPLGHPRELRLAAPRQKLEKNWMLFATADGATHAIYSAVPHRVLQFSLAGDGDIEFAAEASRDWKIESFVQHGGLRGGAPPIEANGVFWSFCHVILNGAAGYDYRAVVYQFATTSPFPPVAAPHTTLGLPNSFGAGRDYSALNPAVAEVIYPGGAVRTAGGWLIAYGINDERAAIARVTDAEVSATVTPVCS